MFDRKAHMEQWWREKISKNQEKLNKYCVYDEEYSKIYYIKKEGKKKSKVKGMILYSDVLKRRDYDKQYRIDNAEHIKKQQKKYSKTDAGKASNQRIKSKRRAREKNIINTLTSQEWLDILEEYNYVCAYCGVEFNCELLPTKDHIIPIIKGGNNTKENIIPACQSCNSMKGSKFYIP